MKKARQSNIELLRIVAMLLIISFHYVYKSGFVFTGLSVNSFIVKAFYMFGELGVNLFILITGYFMINSRFSVKKLICLIIEVDFYYIFSMILGQKLGVVELNTAKDYFLMFFPTIFAKHWFITAYVILYIFSPYLNLLIKNMQKKEHKKLIIISLILWSVIPTIFGVFYNTTENMLFYTRFIWLIIMYLVGAYIKLYPIKSLSNKGTPLLCAIVCFSAMLVSILVICKYIDTFAYLGTVEVAYFWKPNTVLMFILSVSVFHFFLNINIKQSKIINVIATTSLGVYMLHDGPLDRYIWDTIFKTKEHLMNNSWTIIGDILIATIIIFIIGVIIDLIRQFLEKITVRKVLDCKIFNKNAKLLQEGLPNEQH